MGRYITSRLLLAIPTLLGITVLVFLMLHLVPGDPLDYMFAETALTAHDRQILREQLGLNDPLPVQYGRFLIKALQGDLGQSLMVHRPVTQIIAGELPFTIHLAVFGMILIAFFGLSFGVLAALFRNTWLDSVIMVVAISGLSMPDFWLSLMLILVFCVQLGWLPIMGDESLKVLILPAFVIGFRASAVVARLTRSGLLEVMSADYVRTARSKGLRERGIVVRHALRNVLIPVITILGLQFGQLLGGAVVIETVFARRGVGALAVNSILQRDLPLAQGTVLLVAVIYVLVNLFTDLTYAYVDPRVRYS